MFIIFGVAMWTYINVVSALLCPSKGCTVAISCPFSIRCVANECLNECG